MKLEKIKTEGLAHLSYVLVSGGKAAVIDPRRDMGVYLEKAHQAGAQITHIFETHRNEDLISGAKALADVTGANVLHGPNPAEPIAYADTAREGDSFKIGSAELKVLETPGHTDDSISIVIYDADRPDGAVGVFTGDALFVGDVGRTDFYPDRAEEVAGLLFDSLQKLKSLGDQCLIYPAHGAGSVCGSGMADREFSSIGHERANNDRFAMDSRDDFIAVKTAEHHYQPPYFELMERYNLSGAADCARPQQTPILSLGELKNSGADWLLDVRAIDAYLGAHVRSSQALPIGMIASFGGWFLKEADKIGLIADSPAEIASAAAHLCRIGFDNIIGGATGVPGMAVGGADIDALPIVTAEQVKSRLEEGGDWTLLDVRALEEFEGGHIKGALHAYVGEILSGDAKPDLASKITVMCGSGARATLAASYLKNQGAENVDVFYGSMGAWTSAGFDIET